MSNRIISHIKKAANKKQLKVSTICREGFLSSSRMELVSWLIIKWVSYFWWMQSIYREWCRKGSNFHCGTCRLNLKGHSSLTSLWYQTKLGSNFDFTFTGWVMKTQANHLPCVSLSFLKSVNMGNRTLLGWCFWRLNDVYVKVKALFGTITIKKYF